MSAAILRNMLTGKRACRVLLNVAFLGLIFSTVVFAMQQAIPLKDKVARSNFIAVIEVSQVTTQGVFYCTAVVDDTTHEPQVSFVPHRPLQEVLDYLAFLQRAKTFLQDQGNEYGERTLGEIISHYTLDMLARCKIKDVLKGDNNTHEVTVRFKSPIEGMSCVPSPWVLKQGKTYLLFLCQSNNVFRLVDDFQGAHLAGEIYQEVDDSPDGKQVMKRFKTQELFERIRSLSRSP